MNTELLNGLKRTMINYFNENGILISDHFATTDDFDAFVVRTAIREVMSARGLDVSAAYDVVLGDGEYKRLSDAVAEQLGVA